MLYRENRNPRNTRHTAIVYRSTCGLCGAPLSPHDSPHSRTSGICVDCAAGPSPAEVIAAALAGNPPAADDAMRRLP